MLKKLLLTLSISLLGLQLAFAATGGVIYEFYAPWCHVCQALSPKIDQLEKEGVPVTRINIDDNQKLSGKYGIEGVPTLVLVKNGKVQNRLEGDASIDELRKFAKGLQN